VSITFPDSRIHVPLALNDRSYIMLNIKTHQSVWRSQKNKRQTPLQICKNGNPSHNHVNPFCETSCLTAKPKHAKHASPAISYKVSLMQITLTIPNQNGNSKEIQAKFDPNFDPENKRMTDAGKIVFGNRMGNRKERGVTLNISEDAYGIISDSEYRTSDIDKNAKHSGVKKWHYFINDIMFKNESGAIEPYTVFVNVKETDSGEYVYSFYALSSEKASALLAKNKDVASRSSTTNGIYGNVHSDSIAEPGTEVNSENALLPDRRTQRHLEALALAADEAKEKGDTAAWKQIMDARQRLIETTGIRYEGNNPVRIAEKLAVALGGKVYTLKNAGSAYFDQHSKVIVEERARLPRFRTPCRRLESRLQKCRRFRRFLRALTQRSSSSAT